MSYSVTKVFNGYPCAHRQWKHEGHCRFLHGYQRRFVCTFVADSLDERDWVIDFGGPTLKAVRRMLDSNFDHTLLLAEDDPMLPLFQQHDGDLCDLVVLPYGPGMEGTSRFVLEFINEAMGEAEPSVAERGVRCVRVECWENEKNAGAWEVTP